MAKRYLNVGSMGSVSSDFYRTLVGSLRYDNQFRHAEALQCVLLRIGHAL